MHLTLYILSGRSLEMRRKFGAELQTILKRGLAGQVEGRPSDVTADVREMERETYAKDQDRKWGGNCLVL